MIVEQIGTGNSIAEAYENAKQLLNAPEDALLQQEILQDAKKKLFGLKTEPARVRVFYEVPEPVKAQEKKPAPEKKQVDKKPQPAKKPQGEKKAASVQEKKSEKPVQAKKQPEAKHETALEGNTASVVEEKLVEMELPENDIAAEYLKTIVTGMGIENVNIKLEKNEAEDEYIYTLDCGADDGVLIGRRGETLDSIQYLLRLAVNKGVEDSKHKKLSVNVGNYRERRNESLRAIAAKNAKQVLKYGRNAVLEPMNPYERRIIHTAIQGIDGVTSHSVGSDQSRRVVISLEDGVVPTNPSKGGYHRDSRGDRNNRHGGGKGRYQKKEPYKPSVTREPRKDSAGSLYGKIEIPTKPEE